MAKLIGILIFIIMSVVFVVQNMQHVIMNVFFIGKIQERLIFLLIGFYIMGMITVFLIHFIWKYRKERVGKR